MSRINVKKITGTLILAFCLFVHFVQGQGQLAITMDDPNTYETPRFTWQQRNEQILKALQKHQIKAALFVCGMRVADSSGRKLLHDWGKQGHLIANHSYSHLLYNSDQVSPELFRTDFYKGDSIVRSLKNHSRLFRFPYLKEGNTTEKRDFMRQVLKESGYKNGHVSIDASDWYVDGQMREALKKNPDTDIRPYKEFYIQHILDRAHYYDSLAQVIYHRKVKHTLLLHHNLLNALFLDELLSALKKDGWQLIPADDAYTDTLYAESPSVIPCGESIVWQVAKTNKETAKTLRYPAEDGEYEKVGLEKCLKKYGTR